MVGTSNAVGKSAAKSAWMTMAALLAFALLGLAARADDKSTAEETLKGKGLTKSGATYLLEADVKLPESLKNFRAVKKQLDDDNRKRAEIEGKIRMAKGAIGQWELDYRNLNEKLSSVKDAFQHNQIIGQINATVSKIKEGNEFREAREAELAKAGNSRDSYVTTVMELTAKMDETTKQYEELAADEDVKGALAKINQTARPKMKLGPSENFLQNARIIHKERDTIKSDVVQVAMQGHVPHVDVVFNGKVTRSLVLDSGASVIALTADLAKALEMVPGPNDEVMHLQLADGKVVEARHMVIKSVRVGQFTVEDVDCAVLPDSLVAADNLLGGSFLRNFVYKLDPQAGELHMSQISGKVDPNKANPLDKKPAGGPTTKPSDKKTAEKKPAAKESMDEEPKAKGGNPLDK